MTECGGNTKRERATSCGSRVMRENIQIVFGQEVDLTERFNTCSITICRRVG
jgi:hypothetical protein